MGPMGPMGPQGPAGPGLSSVYNRSASFTGVTSGGVACNAGDVVLGGGGAGSGKVHMIGTVPVAGGWQATFDGNETFSVTVICGRP